MDLLSSSRSRPRLRPRSRPRSHLEVGLSALAAVLDHSRVEGPRGVRLVTECPQMMRFPSHSDLRPPLVVLLVPAHPAVLALGLRILVPPTPPAPGGGPLGLVVLRAVVCVVGRAGARTRSTPPGRSFIVEGHEKLRPVVGVRGGGGGGG